jgi:hypothetical protein
MVPLYVVDLTGLMIPWCLLWRLAKAAIDFSKVSHYRF